MHRAPSTAVAYDAAGNLYSAGYDSRLIRWEAGGQSPRWVSEHDELINSIAIDGNTVFTASADRTIGRWDAQTGRSLGKLPLRHRDDLNVVRLSPDGKYIAVGGEEGAVWLYDAEGTLLWRRDGGTPDAKADCIDAIVFAGWSREGGLVIAGDDSGYIQVYDLKGQSLRSVDTGGTIECATADPQARRIYFGLDDGRVVAMDATENTEPAVIRPHTSAVKALAVSPEGSLLVSAAYDGWLVVCDAASLRELSRHALCGEGRIGWARGIAFDPGRPGVLAVTSLGQNPHLWSVSSAAPCASRSAATFGINAVAARNGCVVFGGDDGVVYRRIDNTRVPIMTMGTMINGLALTDDGRRLAVASQDGTTVVLDFESRNVLGRIPGDGSPATCCAWAPDGNALAIGSYNRLTRVLDGDAFCPMSHFVGADTVKSITFIGKTEIAIGGADGHLVVKDIGSEAPRHSVDGLYLINGVSWSPARQEIATVGRDLKLRRWSRRLELLEERHCHDRSIKGVAWSPSGDHLASASYDGKIGIYHVGREITYAQGHRKPGSPTVDWIDDGTIISGGWDGTLRSWNLEGKETGHIALGQAG